MHVSARAHVYKMREHTCATSWGAVHLVVNMDQATVVDLLLRLERGDSSVDISRELTGRYECAAAASGRTRTAGSGPASHEDAYAASIMPRDFPDSSFLSPREVNGDGNCLYCAASVLAKGTEEDQLELRLRTALELSLHANFYAVQMAGLAVQVAASPEVVAGFSSSSLLQSTLSVTTDASFVAAKQSGLGLEAAYEVALHAGTPIIAKPGTYSSLQHMWALATMMGVSVRSVYPQENVTLRGLLHNLLHPRIVLPGQYTVTVNIMWSAMTVKHALSSGLWRPNHFVPLLYSDEEPHKKSRDISNKQPQRRSFTILDFMRPANLSQKQKISPRKRSRSPSPKQQAPEAPPLKKSQSLPPPLKMGVHPSKHRFTQLSGRHAHSPPLKPPLLSKQTSVQSPKMPTSTHPDNKSTLPPANDTGRVITHGMPVMDVSKVVDALSNGEKHTLLVHHMPPPSVLPSTFSHGCYRKLQVPSQLVRKVSLADL